VEFIPENTVTLGFRKEYSRKIKRQGCRKIDRQVLLRLGQGLFIHKQARGAPDPPLAEGFVHWGPTLHNGSGGTVHQCQAGAMGEFEYCIYQIAK